jgi:hypothetical protein
MTETVLTELGIGDGTQLMLISPPDGVLAEAGKLRPRPSFASSVMTAEPTDVIAWWPEGDTFTAAALARLEWMVAWARGVAWVILDPGEGAPGAPEAARLAAEHGLRVTATRVYGQETALRFEAERPRE